MANGGNSRDLSALVESLYRQSRCAMEQGSLDIAIAKARDAFDLAAEEMQARPRNNSINTWINALVPYSEVRLKRDPHDEDALRDLIEGELAARKLTSEFEKFDTYRRALSRCLLLRAKYADAAGSHQMLTEIIGILSPVLKRSKALRYKTVLVDAYIQRASLPGINQETAIADLATAAELQAMITDAIPDDVREKQKLAELRKQLDGLRSDSD